MQSAVLSSREINEFAAHRTGFWEPPKRVSDLSLSFGNATVFRLVTLLSGSRKASSWGSLYTYIGVSHIGSVSKHFITLSTFNSYYPFWTKYIGDSSNLCLSHKCLSKVGIESMTFGVSIYFGAGSLANAKFGQYSYFFCTFKFSNKSPPKYHFRRLIIPHICFRPGGDFKGKHPLFLLFAPQSHVWLERASCV